MQLTLQPNGNLRLQDGSGRPTEIGPEHPEYQRYYAAYRSSSAANPIRTRLLGGLFIVLGLAAWWYEWHMLMTEGRYSIRLGVFAPLGVFGGLLMIFYPEAAGPMRPDTPKPQKVATLVTLALFAVASGINMYLMENYRP